jgi:Ca2+-binding EF-hand superfamily protein
MTMEMNKYYKPIFRRESKLRTVMGDHIKAIVQAFEQENPYTICLKVFVSNESNHLVEIQQGDIVAELRGWIKEPGVRNPMYVMLAKTEEAMNRFVKFGQTPSQEDLVCWIMSRCTLDEDSNFLEFGSRGRNNRAGTFHSEGTTLDQEEEGYISSPRLANMHANNTTTATEDYIAPSGVLGGPKSSSASERPSSAPLAKSGGLFGSNAKHSGQLNNFHLTQSLKGKSGALQKLHDNGVDLKGRKDSRRTGDKASWGTEQYRLEAFINRGRQAIDNTMEERRRLIEVQKTRTRQSLEKFRTIRNTLSSGKDSERWVREANDEVILLRQIEVDIRDDLVRQRARAQRNQQHVRWTMAPNGYANRRGKSLPGPVIGHGPLPVEATTSFKDPRVESALSRYYWDSMGRRHKREADMEDGTSAVAHALEAIKKAASSASSYKLDLRQIFKDMDTSGDGYVTYDELRDALQILSTGNTDPKLRFGDETCKILFEHFDPNDSGSINYGEFLWSFFNRRTLVRQWTRQTKGMTHSQIRTIFHTCDLNGDGVLAPREFKKLLTSLNIHVSDPELETLIDQFDKDGDGRLDLYEFLSFMESEREVLTGTAEQIKAVEHARVTSPARQLQCKGTGKFRDRPDSAPAQRGRGGGGGGRHQRPLGASEETVIDRYISPKRLGPGGAGLELPSATTRTLNIHGLAASPGRQKASSGTYESTRFDYNAGEVLAQATLNTADGIDVLRLTETLQRQAETERKLGHKYYGTH